MGDAQLAWEDLCVLRLPVPFERVYEEEYDGCVRLAYVLTGSWPLAERIARRALVAVRGDWERIGQLDEPVNRIKHEVAERALPAGSRVVHLGFRQRPVEAQPDAPEDFWAAVRHLPRRQAQAVAIYYLENSSTQAVADVLGVSNGIAHNHVEAGRRALAHQLELDMEESP
jgi:DNA-directed RNA polymerase specialized sigma24 family protein